MKRPASERKAIRNRIVAEVSKNWPEEHSGLLSQRFEEVIRVNAERGYCLESWQLSRCFAHTTGELVAGVNETIIAVFVTTSEVLRAPRRAGKGKR